jgi:hypothetical protein
MRENIGMVESQRWQIVDRPPACPRSVATRFHMWRWLVRRPFATEQTEKDDGDHVASWVSPWIAEYA